MALAGPAVNVVIAAVLFFVLGRTAEAEVAHLEDPRSNMLARLAGVNVMLVIFNLIPAFPMDGGRVLRALLAMRLSYGRATQVAASVGQGIAFLFGFLGLLYNPLLIFIAIVVYLGAAAEAGQAQMKEITTGMPVSEAMVTHFLTLPPDADIDRAAEALLMHREVPVVHHRASFEEAFRRMQECQCPDLGVVNGRGELIGLVTPEAVGEMMMVRSVLPRDVTLSWRQSDSGAGMRG